ncbi:MAG: hypothetical protein H0U52_06680 [Chloroflexi bacterium]|nr:hypothetical protein [Chloroflexota bacterium]
MREVAAIFVEAIDVRKIDAANIAVNDGERRSSASDKRAYVDREALRLLRTDLGRVLCEARWNKVPPRGGWLAFLETRGIAHQRDSECRELYRASLVPDARKTGTSEPDYKPDDPDRPDDPDDRGNGTGKASRDHRTYQRDRYRRSQTAQNGRGRIAPAVEVVRLTASEVEFVRLAAVARNDFRRYSQRRDDWGRGFVPDAPFNGMLGELAACKHLNKRTKLSVQIDTELREKGDGGKDLVFGDLVVQVKTKVTGTQNLIKRLDGGKALKALGCDVFLFVRRITDAEFHLVGWITGAGARAVGKHGASRRDSHWNLDIDPCDLEPISRLVTKINLNLRSVA